jgi:hypothetical protein
MDIKRNVLKKPKLRPLKKSNRLKLNEKKSAKPFATAKLDQCETEPNVKSTDGINQTSEIDQV